MREQPDDAIEKRDDPAVVRYAARPSPRGIRFLIYCVLGMSVGLLLLFAYWARPRVHSRDISPRAWCASNLRGIGQGLKVYASDYADAYPPTLRTLIDDGVVTAWQLISPVSGHATPACDYYYVTGLTLNDPAMWIVAYGDPAYLKGAGANVLYVDGHVAFVKEPQFSQDLARFRADYETARGTPPVIIPPR